MPASIRTTRGGVSAGDPDADILAYVCDGDLDSALRHLMQRYRGLVHRVCHREIGDSSLADDITQQVFFQAFRDLPCFEGRCTVRSWLLAITRHRLLDAARSRRRAHARVVDEDSVDLTEIADPQPSAAEWLDDLRLKQVLVESLENLDATTQTAVILRYLHGMTFDDMAALCREKPNTLHARVTRTLARLRTKIGFRIARPSPPPIGSVALSHAA
jgi:RNA polymerase sigma factor (sigma-70 family)